jgi:hypothetical protein
MRRVGVGTGMGRAFRKAEIVEERTFVRNMAAFFFSLFAFEILPNGCKDLYPDRSISFLG